MPTSQKRSERIATAYNALVREGLPKSADTYLLAVERIDRLAAIQGKGGEDG